MTKYKYLLVAEGPTDIAFLKQLTAKLGSDLNSEIEIVELSPQKDATSGNYPPHGWGVKTWCKSWKIKTEQDLHSISPVFLELAKRRNWKALVASSSADGLIIQMDTDIAEQISDLEVKFVNSGKTRKDYCSSVILFWLGESASSESRPYLLLPSYAIETWILAIHDPSHEVFSDLDNSFNYEEIPDLENRLITLGYVSKKHKGTNRLLKKEHLYIDYADKVHSNFSDVIGRCSEANLYSQFLESKNK